MGDPTMTARLESILRSGGLKFKDVDAFGSQVIVTCWSRDAAEKVAKVLKRATFNLRGIVESVDYNENQSKRTTNRPAMHRVWRVGAYA
jgi:hypothetical protein